MNKVILEFFFFNCQSNYPLSSSIAYIRKALHGRVPESPGDETNFPNGSAEAIAAIQACLGKVKSSQVVHPVWLMC